MGNHQSEKGQDEDIDFHALCIQTHTQINRLLSHLSSTHYLVELIEVQPNLEISAPSTDDDFWFRFGYTGVDENDLDGVNRMILYELWRISKAVISEDHIDGRFTLRARNLNKLSYTDIDILVEQITSIGKVLVKEYLPC